MTTYPEIKKIFKLKSIKEFLNEMKYEEKQKEFEEKENLIKEKIKENNSLEDQEEKKKIAKSLSEEEKKIKKEKKKNQLKLLLEVNYENKLVQSLQSHDKKQNWWWSCCLICISNFFQVNDENVSGFIKLQKKFGLTTWNTDIKLYEQVNKLGFIYAIELFSFLKQNNCTVEFYTSNIKEITCDDSNSQKRINELIKKYSKVKTVDIVENINNNFMMIVPIGASSIYHNNQLGGHFVLVCGYVYSNEKLFLVIMDPNSKELRVIEKELFDKSHETQDSDIIIIKNYSKIEKISTN
jgi:hypothetical protein